MYIRDRVLSTVADNVRDTIPFPSTVTTGHPGFIYFSPRRALHNVPRVCSTRVSQKRHLSIASLYIT